MNIDNFHERSLASFWNETEFWFKFFPKYEELAKLVRLARLSLASPDPFLSPADLLSESDVMATESSKLSEVLSKLEFMNNKKSITNPAGFKKSLINHCSQMDSHDTMSIFVFLPLLVPSSSISKASQIFGDNAPQLVWSFELHCYWNPHSRCNLCYPNFNFLLVFFAAQKPSENLINWQNSQTKLYGDERILLSLGLETIIILWYLLRIPNWTFTSDENLPPA